MRRIPKRCFYCGCRIYGEWVCQAHRCIFESDPLGRTARLPLIPEMTAEERQRVLERIEKYTDG